MGVDVPAFIRLLREGDVNAALEVIIQSNCLPSVCGRICSAPCEIACVLTDEGADPIGIRHLERYAADFGKVQKSREKIVRAGKKVAIIGAGPSGLSAAMQLARKGYQVTIFEALDKPGGVMRYGVPEFRISKKSLDKDINLFKHFGIEIKTTHFMGQNMRLKDILSQGFSALLLASGAGMPKFMELPGANLGGVYYGEEFLMRVNLTKANFFAKYIPTFRIGKKVAVIGSGNTALDCARAAVRFGRTVTLLFRRTEEEMRVQKVEREYGKEEGICFEPLVRPIEILGDQNYFVRGLKCVRMDYADPEQTDHWKLMEVPESEFIMDVDTVIIAIGHRPNTLVRKFSTGLNINDDETIYVDEQTGMTSIEGIFAAGNVVTNAGPVVEALASGKKAAESIDQYLR
ncbi:Glutamate synthase [NADPH] small chain [hydrothermal vent metagenome]|uniref:Glutamate synthase [NADPH] small chain n=1 Tax=hydrothermal vent metagenome TaxID=652676 RepID=A0A3B1E0V0_9ZZZZ